MDLIRTAEDKVAKAARSGSRLQNRACDQCRRSKRRCDLAEAGSDGLPIQHNGPCKLCVRKNLQCTSHWADLQQTVSSSRQELRHISQTSVSYSALHQQLAMRDFRPAGLLPSTRNLNDTLDNLYISTQQLSTYINAWEWNWHHLLGPNCVPAGVGIDVVAQPRFGLLNTRITGVWDSFTVADKTPHISPKFFFLTLACDEAHRAPGRLQRLPVMADQISTKALYYAMVAYASQYGSQGFNNYELDNDPSRRHRDIEIAEAAWTRARDFLMSNATIRTFRMAYACHLFANTCPPLRADCADSNVTADSAYLLQTGLKMMDDLAAELRSQQQEQLLALGYFGLDGTRMDSEVLLRSEPGFRSKVDRSKALIGIAESLMWYSVVCDSACSTSVGMAPVVRESRTDEVDLDSLAMLPSNPNLSATEATATDTAASMPATVPAPPGFDDHQGLLRLAPGMLQPQPLPYAASSGSAHAGVWNARPERAEIHESILVDSSAAVEKQFATGKGPWTTEAEDPSQNPWYRTAIRIQKVRKRIPALLSKLSAMPDDTTTVKEFLAVLQTGVGAQVMLWQRVGNFRASLNDPSCPAKRLVNHFQRAFSMLTFVQKSFQPIFDLHPQLYFSIPASAQSMAVLLINSIGTGSLHFLETCSFLEGAPWLQGLSDKSWPRAAMILREQLEQSRTVRNEYRRQTALRITHAHRMVQEQIQRTLRADAFRVRETHFGVGSVGGDSRRTSEDPSDGLNKSPSVKRGRVDVVLPQDELIVPALQIHVSRHPVPTVLADSLHLSFCALVPDALEEISQRGAASSLTLDSLEAALMGLQGITECVLNFGPFYLREPSVEMLFSTRNWLAPDRAPMMLRA
ncbi:hypothetical protein BCV70DRAFT_154391 [Testicularia cyperi]|uniref:Zn(2)-C6 fungal-type domain-containing protein n=1 Tax=Testicularia cyperi TaxID=1882483 RepID=A0A317XZ39_9BASI|nr:hypothetical protein BCV70DRAFT_154391 [Testicularia cyperi]